MSGGFYQAKKRIIEQDLANLKRIRENLVLQNILQQEDLALSQKTFEANKALLDGKVISDFDFRLENSRLIGRKLSLSQVNLSMITNENLQNDKSKELMEIDDLIRRQNTLFLQELQTYKSHLEEWKRKYMLLSPTSGKIALISFLQQDQLLRAGEAVCFVNPEDSKYFAEVVIPQTNFGKVKVGQKTILKFSSYPSEEFGYVVGNISFISTVPFENGYRATVDLPNGLITNHHRKIQFREGLVANAEIVSRDLRLIERIYFDLIKKAEY